MHSGHLSQHKSGTEGAGIIYDDTLKWCWTKILDILLGLAPAFDF